MAWEDKDVLHSWHCLRIRGTDTCSRGALLCGGVALGRLGPRLPWPTVDQLDLSCVEHCTVGSTN